MATKKKTKFVKKIDYKEKMTETLRTILDLQNVREIQNWFSGISNLMQFGRNYSPNNLLLVHAQKMEAIWTEGFYTWKTKYRRFVQKGEKGILIFAPVHIKKNQEKDIDSHEYQVEKKDSEKKDEKNFVLFRPVYVWDYLQTRGDRIAKIESMIEKRSAAKKEIYGTSGENIKILSKAMVKLIMDKGLKIVHQDLGPAGGMAIGKTIFIDKALGIGDDLGVIIHEFSHVMLGHKKTKDNESAIELEAELTVGLVKSGLDLDIQSQAAYLHSWSRNVDANLKEEKFLNAFKVSQPLANEILNHLNSAIATEDEVEPQNVAA